MNDLLTARQITLYSTSLPQTELDLRLKHLSNLRGKEANALLQEVRNSAPECLKMSLSLALTNKKGSEVLRAMLLLLEEKTIEQNLARPKFLSPLQKALLELKNDHCDDTGLTAVIKEYPYQSSKYRYTSGIVAQPVNLNGAAYFKNGQVITCRHLAAYHAWKISRDAGFKFKCEIEFTNEEAIKRNVTYEMRMKYAEMVDNAAESHLIDNAKFGNFLSNQFASMEASGQQTKVMLMSSTNHAMSLALRIKKKEGKKFYVVKLFDPNETTHHIRCAASERRSFEKQTVASYITSESALQSYYPETNGVSLFSVISSKKKPDDSISFSNEHSQKTLTSIDCKITPTVLYHLMKGSFAGSLSALKEQIDALPLERKITVLGAKNSKDFPGLKRAIFRGDAATIRKYGELLALIPEDSRAELIADTVESTKSCIDEWKAKGSIDTIKAFSSLNVS